MTEAEAAALVRGLYAGELLVHGEVFHLGPYPSPVALPGRASAINATIACGGGGHATFEGWRPPRCTRDRLPRGSVGFAGRQELRVPKRRVGDGGGRRRLGAVDPNHMGVRQHPAGSAVLGQG